MRGALLAGAIAILGAACSSEAISDEPAEPGVDGDQPAELTESEMAVAQPTELVTSEGSVVPPPPDVPTGITSPALLADLDALFGAIETGELQPQHLVELETHDDLRVGWILADLLRFAASEDAAAVIAGAFETLTGLDLTGSDSSSTWKAVNDHLMAWDVPAFDEYVAYKKRLFTRVEPGWAPFFDDPDSLVDWRFVTWGGVLIDDRELGSTLPCPRGCIPALDDPPVTGAADGDWYPDSEIVFGVVVNGEARAYPKNMMEVHEMVNDTLGTRRIGMPYCTLCGSAQVYFTDSVPEGVETPVLRTSGLLSRSNKVMFDQLTDSVFDTFTGEAVSGPLREKGVVLEQGTVVTSTWEAWKQAHPDTTILGSDGGLGRVYSLDPLRGRDDNGPIFPVGAVDGRLAVQEQVIGVIAPDGTPLAFPVVAARITLDSGGDVEMAGVSLILDGDGLRASTDDGVEVAAHQAFWFAWSQFNPETEIWSAG